MKLSSKDKTITKLALKKLQIGADAFNLWRGSQRKRQIQLFNQNFDGWRLDGVNFLGTKLIGCSFQKTSLQNSSFVAANLNKVNFTGADLTNADFNGARMYQSILDQTIAERVNFFGTMREAWSIKGINCQTCWITSSREENPARHDSFKPGEFESIYGGTKVRIVFTDGIEPIDLLALPFYAKSLLDKFPDKKLVFAGLSALGSPSLEFRVEDAKVASSSTADMQAYFNSHHSEVRASVMALVSNQLSRKDEQISELTSTLKYIAQTKNEPRTLINMGEFNQFNQEQGVQGRIVSKNQIVQLNLSDQSQMAQVAMELEKLLNLVKAIPNASEQDKQSLSEAAAAAKNQDSKGVLNALKKAGGWLLDFSKGVGVELAAAALTKAMGLESK
jgi:uncharacterized protein YjbI with pentapeptide repeats